MHIFFLLHTLYGIKKKKKTRELKRSISSPLKQTQRDIDVTTRRNLVKDT